MISTAQILPLLGKLGGYLKEAAEHLAQMQKVGQGTTPEVLAAFVEDRMAGWDPDVKGVKILDPGTRAAAARLLAGIAINTSRIGK